MGQRHQIIAIYPEKYLNKGNPNNKPERAEVIHHQWLYGRSVLLALHRVLTLAANSWDGTGTDYLFGRGEDSYSIGYSSGNGTQAIAAAISVDPTEGYYHRVRVWEAAEWNKMEPGGYVAPQKLDPDMFNNNDGITVIRFYRGKKKPGYALITPGHLEGRYWNISDGFGPWSAKDYLEFYYSKEEQGKWSKELRERMCRVIDEIGSMSTLMGRDELKELFPLFHFEDSDLESNVTDLLEATV